MDYQYIQKQLHELGRNVLALWMCVLLLVAIYVMTACKCEAAPKRHGVHIVNYTFDLKETEARLQTNRALRLVTRKMKDKWTIKSYIKQYKPVSSIRPVLIMNLPPKPDITVVFMDSDTYSYGIAPVCSTQGMVAGIGLAGDLVHGDSSRSFIKATLAHEIIHNLGGRHTKTMSLMSGSGWLDWHTTNKRAARWRIVQKTINEVCRCERLYSFTRSETCRNRKRR